MEQVDQGEKYICEQKQKNKLKRFQFDTTEEYIHKLRTSIALDKNLYRLYDSCSYNTECKFIAVLLETSEKFYKSLKRMGREPSAYLL